MQLGVGRMTVARLESGANVSIDTAMRAVSELGFTLAAVPKFSRVRIESDDA